MRSMTFQIDDQSTGSAVPAVIVTITENGDGTVSFTLNVVGSYTGDLRGFFFDLADETLINTLRVTSPSAGFTEFRQANDTVVDLGDGSTMDGLLGRDGGYDAGVEIGTSGMGTDDYQSFTFTLSSTASELTLEDFSNVDFGVRLTSVGLVDGSRNASAKLLEHTSSAIDAQDDVNSVQEDVAPNPVVGNVFANDANLAAVHVVTAVNGSASDVGVDLAGTYGTLHLYADGSYTYTLDNTNAAVQALADGQEVSESFTYTATSSDESTSSSTDSATLTITIVGTNDAPVITTAVDAGSVAELAEDSPQETVALHSASGTVDFGDVDLLDVHGVSVTPAASGYVGTLTAEVSDDSTGDGVGQVTWTFEVSDAAVEHLAESQSITQTYALSVNDGHGGIAMQDVTITITGANDAPEIVAGDTVGEVFEDGSRGASGQLVAVDIDQDAELTWSVAGSGPMTPWANYRFLIDNLNIVRNGAPFFNDDFGNGVPPPAGTSFGYFTFGTFQEFGGRVIMDGGLGAASTIPGSGTAIAHLATLNTDIGPDVNQGLKRGQDFRVEARYDLVMPADALGTYGVRLSDFANDIVEVDVRRLADGSVVVALREADIAGAVPVTVATIALEPAPGDNQIVLRLEHAAGTDLVTASFDLLNGGVVTQTKTFTVVADIFSNEDWTRAQFNGLAPAMEQNGVYGTLSVEADGEWRYALNNRAANVQALAQGEHATDTFTVRVTDEHGASDTQTVTIDVIGSNDAPVITGGTNSGFVFEDAVQPFQQMTTSGQLTAFDPDHNAVLSWSAGPATTVPVGSGFQFLGYSSDFHFTVDQFTVERNGATIFDDTFSDGIAPPSAPNFSNGTGANYLTNGGRFSESGGFLILDGSVANSFRGIGNPDLVVGQLALLATNTDAADLTRGLKSDDDFRVEARFNLVTPGVAQGYGVALSDQTQNGLPPDQLGDDNVNLFVRADAAGNLSVQFTRFDVPADAVTVYQSLAFTPAGGENQIVLRLTHDADHVGIVHAEFDLIGGADGPRTLHFTQTGQIFGTSTPGYAGDDENWTRVQLAAFGLDTFDIDSDPTTHQGTYGSLSVQQNGQWTYTLDSNAANVQALALGQPAAQDIFSVRVVDEYGMSSFRPVFINVFGSNDPVVITSSATTDYLVEDAVLGVAASITFTDIDLIDFHNAFFAPSPANTTALGFFSLGPVNEAPNAAQGSVGWSYGLNNAAAQYLAEGQTATETYAVTVQDPNFASATQNVTIVITGTNDGPVAADDSFGASGFPATLFDIEDNDTLATAQFIAPEMFGVAPSADVGDPSQPRVSINGFVSPGNDVDFYALHIAAGTTATFDIDYGMFDVDTILGIYNSGGSLMLQIDDFFPETVGGGGSAHGFDAYLQWSVFTSGTYYIAVSSFPNFGPGYSSFGSSGDYVLNISLSSLPGGGGSGDIDEDSVATIAAANLLANDTDVDLGDTLSIVSVSASSAFGASVSLVGGNVVYDPTASALLQALDDGETRTDTFTYTISDGHGGTDTASVTLTVAGVTDNHAPVAADDSYTVAEDEMLLFPVPGVLGNDTDPDGDSLSVVPVTLTTGAGASVTINADGSFVYDSALNVNGPDSFTYTVTDGEGGTDTATVFVNVLPVNEAPVITGGVTTGLVYEDSTARTATGQLTAVDVDSTTLIWGMPAQPPTVFGFVSINGATGQWTYTAGGNAVQSLGQGVSATETFFVSVSDQNGGTSAPQPITITVTGTGDRPTLPSTPVTLSATEDGAAALASTTSGDLDSNFIHHWSLNRGSANGYFSDYEFRADSFSVVKNNTLIFDDEFDGGGVPPSAPNFSDNTTASYTVTPNVPLTGFSEVAGKLVLSGANSLAFRGTGLDELLVGNEAILNTNVNTLNTLSGLKKNHQFVIDGVFDLIEPQEIRQGYGIQLTDAFFQPIGSTNVFGQVADDLITLQVRRDTDDQVYVRLSNSSAVLDTANLIARHLLVPGSANQIRLLLTHDANAGHVTASYELLSGGVPTGTVVTLGQVGIFGTDTPFPGDDENYIRAGLIASGMDLDENVQTLSSEYGTLTVSNNTGPSNQAQFSYLANGSAAQSLGLGQSAIDSFWVRVVDQQGMSTSQRVNVTVNGVNDTPDITGGTATGLVFEDGARVARGQLTAADVDNGSTLTWSILSGPAFGFVGVDASGQWTYTLDNTRLNVQQLAQNATLNDSFVVRVTDEHGASDAGSQQVVTVQIKGADDRPFVNSAPATPAVGEDGVLLASGQATAFDADLGAQLNWSLSRGTTFGYLANNHVTLDRFSIEKNGVLIFDDHFNDGSVPPSAPNFLVPPFAPNTYAANGAYAEAGDRLVMDGAGSVGFTGVGFNGLLVGQSSLLNTNINPLDTAFGLKINHDFTIDGVFDLVVPDEPREGYGIQITDALPGPLSTNLLGDDQISLLVRRNADDDLVYVQLVNSNTVTDVANIVGGVLLNPAGADQIRLKLSHLANSGDVSASYELLNPLGAVIGGGNLGQAAIFGTDTPGFAGDDEIWTRAGFLALGPDQFENVSSLAGTYGALNINGSGQWTYTVNNAAANVQALSQGESVTDSFHLRATDQFGLSNSQPLSISVNGVNDAPDITGGATTGVVYEDGGARFASGQLSAFDVDHNAVVSWTTVGAPLYGFATINPTTGQWTYTLDNNRLVNNELVTQKLAQGQMVTDTFIVRATDEHGAFDADSERLVTVTVNGTNDRPNLPPTPLALSVSEDGAPAMAQTSAFDVDNGSVLHWSLNRGSALGYSSPYEFRADSFSIEKNFSPLFHDDFDAGGPPPQAPNFIPLPPPGGSQLANYAPPTGLLEEIDGNLVFRGSNAFAFRGTGNNSLIVGNEAILATNVDPLNTQAGLKRNHQFVVEGVFDLVEPEFARQQYGLQLTDGVNQLADDLVTLHVRRETDGLMYVRLTTNDAVFDTSSLIAREQVIAGSADQIRLRLSHEAGAGNVSGSYELLDENADGTVTVIGSGSLGSVGIFGTDTAFAGDDNNWIRAGLIANALDTNEFVQTLEGTYGTLTVSALPIPPTAFTTSVGQLNYTPINANPAVQALAQGESVVDSFFVRAVDQFGMSSSQRVNVTVNGTNDAPVISGVASGVVSEDDSAGGNTTSGQLTATDVDHGAVLSWSVLGGGSGAYGSLAVDNTDKWTYTLDNADPDLQALDQGESATETFTVRVTDEYGAFDDQLVTITVNGSDDDAPNSDPIGVADNNDNDPVFEAGVTFTGLPFPGDPTASGNVLANDTDPDAGDELRVVALNAVQLPDSGSLTLGLTYGSLQINADGSWTYTLDNSDPDTNALRQVQPVFAEPVFEHVSYTVADDEGATDTEVLSIRISGTNDAPVAVPDSNTVTEDVVLTAVGNVLANDYDPEGDAIQLIGSVTFPGTYGTLTLNQDGSYVYQLNPALANFLDAGQVVHDIFESRYIVAEGFGGFAQTFATLLDIAVIGTDEAPSVADAAVFEDGGRKASGEVVTTSVDLNAAPVWSIVGAGPMTQVADYRYLIDNLFIRRDGVQFFNDDFGNGLPPPSAPINANPGYFTSGSFQETGGRVIMDGSFAGAAGSGFVGHFATLNTDTSASTTQGLKRNHSFTVEARFELVLPTEALQTYGVRLTDAGIPGGGDDIVEISVRRLADGSFAVLLRETNVVGGTPTILGSIPLVRAPGDQLIVLRLEHAADSEIVTASFDILNGGAISQSHSFSEVGAAGHIFGNGETVTRAQIVGLSPSHAQNGLYGTLSVESDGDWTYSLNNGIANVQGLAQGERVTDTFTVQVSDANGASEPHTVAVDVFGTNDFPNPNLALLFPFFGGGVNGAYVVEDGAPQTARGNTFVSDIDHGPRAHFSVTANAVPGPVTPYSSDYLFRIDELKIIKDGAVTTLDTFNDGAAPGTTNGGDYFATGAFTESGGRAILDGHRASAISGTATSDLVVGNVALLNTNQRAEDPQRGFKTGHDFMAEARFDFDANFMPAAGQGFGIAFTDRAGGEIPPNQAGDDNVYLLVLGDETGNVVVQFSERDTLSDAVTIIGSMPLVATPVGSQIVLRLEHDTADLGRLKASFDVLDGGGTLLQTGAFAEAAHREDRIFGLETPDDPSDDEGWTRFQFLAFGRDTSGTSAEGRFGALSIAEDGDWTYTLNSDPASSQWANLQDLNQGQIGIESFNIRAVDAEGASNSRQLNISVIGTGDGAPAPVNAVGSPGSDVLVGSTLSDLITGNGGGDLLIGLSGADTFDYNSINDGHDTITDFTPGVGGDVLDIRDVLQGYVAPVPMPGMPLVPTVPFNFVQIQTAVSPTSTSTTVAVNADGMGFDYVPLATLQGVGGLLLEDLIANGNLVLA